MEFGSYRKTSLWRNVDIYIHRRSYRCKSKYISEKYHDTCFQQLWDQFSTIIINAIYDDVHFLNPVKLKVTRWGTISAKTVNKHELCYQCSVNVPDLLFVN